MPIVPIIDAPQVAPSLGPAQPMQSVQANPAAFGAQIGEALQGLGRVVDRAGDVAAQQAIQFQMLQNQTAVTEAQTKVFAPAERDLLFGENGYYRKQGKDAIDGVAAVTDQISQLRAQVKAGLANPAQQRMFDEAIERRQALTLDAIARHAAQENTRYQAGAARAALQGHVQDVALNWNNPDRFNLELAQGLRTVDEQNALNGVPPEVARQNRQDFISNAWAARIQAMAVTDPVGALKMTRDYAGVIDGMTVLKLEQALKPRARAVQADTLVDGLWGGSARGADGGWARIEAVESGGRQFDANGQPLVSPAGAVGVAQILPATARGVAERAGIPYDEAKLRTDADYNRRLGQLYHREMMTRYDNMPVLADAAYNAGPGRVDEWIKRYGDPRTGAISPEEWADKIPFDETRRYVAKTGARTAFRPPAAGPGGTVEFPDEARLAQRIVEQTKDDPELQQASLARLRERVSTWNLLNSTERAELGKQFGDAVAALEAGKDDVAVPEDRIRAVFPPAQADDMVGKLNVARMAGQLFRAVQWGSVQDVAAAREDLATGTGRLSTLLRLRGGQVVVGQGDGDAETPDQFRMRQTLLARFDQIVMKRTEALEKDPAGYVLASPAMQQVLANTQDPAAVARASLAQQERLGVPEDKRRVLPQAQTEAIVRRITSLDPAKGDATLVLDQMSRQFGDMWPQVWGDLVQAGKMPPQFQALAWMDQPAQIAARADLQRALVTVATKGEDALKTAATQDKVRDIDKGIDGRIAEFAETARHDAGGADLIRTVHGTVRLLAYHYAALGDSPGAAVERAYRGVLSDKYDFDGTMRVPKGMLPQVRQATGTFLADLTPDKMDPNPPGNPSLSAEQRRQVMFDAAKRGEWVPNARDDGLVLMYQLRNTPQLQVARGADGKPIEIRFADMPAMIAPEPRRAERLPARDMGELERARALLRSPVPGP
jgi:soluble lytic murein transglycosylase